MKNIEIVTLKAAYDTLATTNLKFINLCELQDMCLPKKRPVQHWTYFGNWRKVKPFFHAA